MLVLINHKLVFFHIPRTSGTYILNKLKRNWPRIMYYDTIKTDKDKLDLAHLYYPIIKKYIPLYMLKNYDSFCITRDPYDRLYSIYRLYVTGITDRSFTGKPNISKYYKFNNFEEFCKKYVKKIRRRDINFKNIHLVPQYYFIYYKNKCVVKNIFKYDHTLNKKLNDYIKKKGLNINLEIKLSPGYLSKYTPELVKIVNEVYHKDFNYLKFKKVDPNTFIPPVPGPKRIKRDTRFYEKLKKLALDEFSNHKKEKINILEYYKYMRFGMHLGINNNKVTVIKEFPNHRNKKIVSMLNDCLEKYPIKCKFDFLISTEDMFYNKEGSTLPIFTMAKLSNSNNILYPDHTFIEWVKKATKSWDSQKKSIIDTCAKTKRKINKVFFRGAETHYIRKHVYNNTIDNDIFDIKMTNSNDNTKNFVSLTDHCKWKYLLNIPGQSYAGRLKYLLASDSAVFNIEKKPEYQWNEFWYPLIKESENYIKIKDNNEYDHKNRIKKVDGKYSDKENDDIISQIVKKHKQLEERPDLVKKMAENNKKFIESFTYDSCLYYLSVILKEYIKIYPYNNKKTQAIP